MKFLRVYDRHHTYSRFARGFLEKNKQWVTSLLKLLLTLPVYPGDGHTVQPAPTL